VDVSAVTYAAFLERKRSGAGDAGFDTAPITASLYDFQRDIVEFATRKGRSAIFAECGLGKTPMQLEWARQVVDHAGGNVLILTPLAVAAQTVREGDKFGIEVAHAREAEDAGQITVTNYERLGRFADMPWAGVVLDESSILKAFDGKTRR
jgi:superfamily II DNA or RNA helicase